MSKTTKQQILLARCWQLDGSQNVEILYDGEHVVLLRAKLEGARGCITLLFAREMFSLTCPQDLDSLFPGMTRTAAGPSGTLHNVSGVIYHHSSGSHSSFKEVRGKRWSRAVREALVEYAKLADRQYDEVREAHLEKARVRRESIEAESDRRKGLQALFHESHEPRLNAAETDFADDGRYSVSTFSLTLKLNEHQVHWIARILRAGE